MTVSIDARLAELGLELPQAAAPVAAYVPTVLAGGLLHVSGNCRSSMASW
jgi:enamine deaminase RidA (YjgF/YER057c/UK114 family)